MPIIRPERRFRRCWQRGTCDDHRIPDTWTHARPRGREVPPLAGVAAEIELDRGLERVVLLRFQEDFLRGGQRIRPAGRIRPGDPGRGVGRHAAHQLAGHGRERRPVLLFLQQRDPQRDERQGVTLGFRDARQFRRGFGNHAELEIAGGVGKVAFHRHRSKSIRFR